MKAVDYLAVMFFAFCAVNYFDLAMYGTPLSMTVEEVARDLDFMSLAYIGMAAIAWRRHRKNSIDRPSAHIRALDLWPLGFCIIYKVLYAIVPEKSGQISFTDMFEGVRGHAALASAFVIFIACMAYDAFHAPRKGQ